MKQIALILILITSLFSLDMKTAVELGLEKKQLYMTTDEKLDSSVQHDSELDIRLAYLKFLENRDKLYIVDGGIKRGLTLQEERKKAESAFLDSKSLLGSLISKDIKDAKSVQRVDFSQLQNHSLDTTKEISSLEKELREYDKQKSDQKWNIDVSGDVLYGFGTAKGPKGRKVKGSGTEVELNVVLGRNNGTSENDSTIDIAKKRYDLEKKQMNQDDDMKAQRDEYEKALKKQKRTKDSLKKYDIDNLKTTKEIEEAYRAYMSNTEALYSVYRKYARLLNIASK